MLGQAAFFERFFLQIIQYTDFNLAPIETMKKMLLLLLPAALFASCQRPMPEVPDSGRTVVAPKGSSEGSKSWNRMTREEGEATLGPLGSMSKRR